MNKIALLFILLCFQWGTATAQTFEGTIEMYQVTADGLEYDLKWYIKGNKIAYELSSTSTRGAVYLRFIPQTKTNTMLMVTGDTKQQIPVDEIKGLDKMSVKDASIRSKGNSSNSYFKLINNWEITTSDLVIDVELTPEIPINFSDYKNFFKTDYGLYALGNSDKKGFPLSTITKDKKGNVITKTVLKRVSREAVPDSIFQ